MLAADIWFINSQDSELVPLSFSEGGFFKIIMNLSI